jgi:hypothetical protein
MLWLGAPLRSRHYQSSTFREEGSRYVDPAFIGAQVGLGKSMRRTTTAGCRSYNESQPNSFHFKK